MAGMVGDRDGILIPMLQEPEDSGIDSDDTERARVQPDDALVPLTDTSSSDEDPIAKAPWMRSMKNVFDDLTLTETGSSDEELAVKGPWAVSAKKKYDDRLENVDEGHNERDVLMPMVSWHRSRLDCDSYMIPDSPDRSSPPLYEVELTASDEDDDASVLELVIPVQSARYKRVPNFSPIKTAFSPSFICSVFCCFRN